MRRCDTCKRIVAREAFYAEGWQRGEWRSDLASFEDTCRACIERRRLNEQRDDG